MDTNQHAGSEHHSHPVEHNKQSTNMMAIFAYLWILIVVPFLTDARKDPFVKYHLKQGLALIIFEAVGWILGMFIGFIPVIGALIIWIWWLASLVLLVIGIINVVNGQEKELPFLGQYAKHFNF